MFGYQAIISHAFQLFRRLEDLWVPCHFPTLHTLQYRRLGYALLYFCFHVSYFSCDNRTCRSAREEWRALWARRSKLKRRLLREDRWMYRCSWLHTLSTLACMKSSEFHHLHSNTHRERQAALFYRHKPQSKSFLPQSWPCESQIYFFRHYCSHRPLQSKSGSSTLCWHHSCRWCSYLLTLVCYH